jgi:DNA-binding transcriptional LysR family regulator
LDFEALRAFIAVTEHSSFSRAAEALYLTQPAVSKRIQSLEQQFDVTLFERMQKGVRLTVAGDTLYRHALSILQQLDNARHALADLNDTVCGTLRIVASHHVGLHRLPRILQQFSQRFPEVDLQLNFLDSESAFRVLRDNQADLAFVTVPDRIADELQCHLLWDDPMSIVCARDHALAAHDALELTSLADYEAILPSQATLTYRVVEAVFSENQLRLKARIPTNYLETMKMMASVGMGWTVLPNTMIDETLQVLPIRIPTLHRRLGALSYRNKYLHNAAHAFIDIARSEGR